MATRKPGTGPARPQGRIAETRHPEIKARHRALRADLPTALDLKVHRALSWLDRAEQETEDEDTRFILLWIGFNAAYARRIDESFTSEQGRFKAFFRKLVDLDDQGRIYAVLWSRFSNEIRTLLVNPYVFPDFWRHHNGEAGFADWRARLEADRRETLRLLGKQETREVLGPIFERLYVLRNQLVHGGATWNGRVNRDQVRDGAALLGRLLPAFIEIMMDHPRRDWGEPFYPVVQA
ncbi:MAG: hypothetical protein RL588_646 [Pseudomonadota bacterium]|jgi:hypothetical protein